MRSRSERLAGRLDKSSAGARRATRVASRDRELIDGGTVCPRDTPAVASGLLVHVANESLD